MAINIIGPDDLPKIPREFQDLTIEDLNNPEGYVIEKFGEDNYESAIGEYNDATDLNNILNKKRKKKPKVTGAKWRPAAPRIFPKGKVEKLRSKLKPVKKTLERIQKTLETAENLVSVLSQLESLVTDPLASIGKTIINELNMYIENVGSTGVYVLDAVNYYRIEEPLIGTGASKSDQINEYLKQTKLDLNYQTTSTTLDYNSANKNKIGDIFDTIAYFFRPVTYEEFIQDIADAFIDPDDLPERNEKFEFVKKEKSLLGFSTKSSFSKEKLGSDWDSYGTNMLRPGAPKWGKASKATVYVLAFNSGGDPLKFIQSIKKIQDLFYPLFGGDNNSKESSQEEKKAGEIDRIIESARREGKEYSEIFDELTKATSDVASSSIGGSGMDFYGMSIESVFPNVFKRLRGLSKSLEKLLDKVVDSLSGLFDGVIEGMEKFIAYINDIITTIDDIVNFIDALLTMNMSILKITSTGGVNDIYQQLLNAEGFPEQEKNRSQIIVGIVLAVGAPGPDDSGFSLASYFNSQKAFFDEQKGELKQSLQSDPSIGFDKIMNKFSI